MQKNVYLCIPGRFYQMGRRYPSHLRIVRVHELVRTTARTATATATRAKAPAMQAAQQRRQRRAELQGKRGTNTARAVQR